MAWPLSALAQQSRKIPRVCFITFDPGSLQSTRFAPFFEGLRDLGYVSTVPIVMVSLGDPIGTGLVESLANPGGNVTGVSFMAPVVAAKRLELLNEVAPRISRVLVQSLAAN